MNYDAKLEGFHFPEIPQIRYLCPPARIYHTCGIPAGAHEGAKNARDVSGKSSMSLTGGATERYNSAAN
jgi:hypothetical protein